MNLARREEVEELQDLSDIGPRNVEGRLREWSRARWYGSVNPWPPESALYAVWKSPGRATDTSGDGGMAALMDRAGKRLGIEARVREVTQAINALPPVLRDLVLHMYAVSQRERPRTEKSCADHFRLSRSEVAQRYGVALGWLGRELAIPEIWWSKSKDDATY